MPLSKFLQQAEKYELKLYKEPKKIENLKDTHVPYSGSPRKHPFDKEIVILLADPYSTNTSYYEFKIKDINYVEELPNIVNVNEETVTMVRIWVKKSSVGILCTPFIAEDTINSNISKK